MGLRPSFGSRSQVGKGTGVDKGTGEESTRPAGSAPPHNVADRSEGLRENNLPNSTAFMSS